MTAANVLIILFSLIKVNLASAQELPLTVHALHKQPLFFQIHDFFSKMHYTYFMAAFTESKSKFKI